MSAVFWPDTVNQFMDRGSFNEQPERNVVSFQPDVGPPIERRRSSIATTMLSGSGRGTRAEWDSLVAFYKDTLNDGIDPFVRLHPDTNVPIVCKFTGDAPKLTSVGALYRHFSLSMRILPEAVATFSGSIASTVLTIDTAVVGTAGPLAPGFLIGAPGMPFPTLVTGFLTGTGGSGTYRVNISDTIGERPMTAIPAAV